MSNGPGPLWQGYPQRGTLRTWNGVDGGQVGSSVFSPPNRGLIMFEKGLHHSYMLDMSMRLMCFSYPSWLATSRNSSVIRIKPRSKLNSAGNFRIQYLKGSIYFSQLEDFKLGLHGKHCIILYIAFNSESRTICQISDPLPPIHHTGSLSPPATKDPSFSLPHWASLSEFLEPHLRGIPSPNSRQTGGNVYGEEIGKYEFPLSKSWSHSLITSTTAWSLVQKKEREINSTPRTEED